MTAQIALFYCPSRRSPPQIGEIDERTDTHRKGSLCDYAVAPSDNTDNATTAYDLPGATGAIIIGIRSGNQWDSRTRFADVSDGLSNTILIGEKHIRLGSLRQVNGDRTVWNGDHADVFSRIAGPGKGIVGDLNTATNQRFGSYHPGICQFVLGDGGVRALRVTTPDTTLSLLIQRADGQVIPDYN